MVSVDRTGRITVKTISAMKQFALFSKNQHELERIEKIARFNGF